jgi:stage V sporulation protein G
MNGNKAYKVADLLGSVRVFLLEGKEPLKATASFQLGGVLWVTGLRVIQGKTGLFVSWPSRKSQQGEYQDVCFPGSKEARDDFSKAILDEYARVAAAPVLAAV